jgi:hypothetical protein
MRAVLYDCRDAGKGCTLRIFSESQMTVQAQMLGDDPVGISRLIAAGLEIDLEYVGPPPSPPGGRKSRAKSPDPELAATLDAPVVYAVPETPRPPKRPELVAKCKQASLF